MRIGIIGYGYVGKAIHKFVNTRYECAILDPAFEFTKHEDGSPPTLWRADRYDINECNIAIICVPTPPAADGSCDVSLIEEVVDWIKCDLIIIKSTVEPGTTNKLKKNTGKRIVFSPEFCGESTYWTEYNFHKSIIESPWFVFGGDPADTAECVELYMTIGGPTKQYHQTDLTTAELVKYATNCFYATKITFCYELAQICNQFNVDYNELREMWLSDPRINKMHTAVFQDNDQPFSGKCFPKDLLALITASTKTGYEPKLLQEILDSNQRIRQIRQNRSN